MTHRIARLLLSLVAIGVLMALPRLAAQDRGVAAAPADDWPAYNRSYAGDRFSPLNEITAANAAQLRQVCLFDTGEQVSFETGPLVVSGVMYVTSDRTTYALDASTCVVRWKQTQSSPATSLGVNRGAAYDAGRLFRGVG